MATTPLISIEAARDHLNLEASTRPARDGSDDAEIYDHIIAATEIINSEKGYSAPTSFTEQVAVSGNTDPFGYPLLLVTRLPLLSVQAIVDLSGNATVDLTSLGINPLAGVITVRSTMILIGPIEITYTAGRSPIPTTLKQTCKEFVKWFWETQRGGGATVPGTGEGSSGGEGDGMPWQAKLLLDMAPESAGPGFA